MFQNGINLGKTRLPGPKYPRDLLQALWGLHGFWGAEGLLSVLWLTHRRLLPAVELYALAVQSRNLMVPGSPDTCRDLLVLSAVFPAWTRPHVSQKEPAFPFPGLSHALLATAAARAHFLCLEPEGSHQPQGLFQTHNPRNGQWLRLSQTLPRHCHLGFSSSSRGCNCLVPATVGQGLMRKELGPSPAPLPLLHLPVPKLGVQGSPKTRGMECY